MEFHHRQDEKHNARCSHDIVVCLKWLCASSGSVGQLRRADLRPERLGHFRGHHGRSALEGEQMVKNVSSDDRILAIS